MGSWNEHADHAALYRELNAPVASYGTLCTSARRGLPDNAGIRPLTWALLLHATPLNRGLRDAKRAEHGASYWRFVEMFMAAPHEPHKAHLLQRIRNDIKRTMRVNHLFASNDSHSASLIRILFVFANLWPQIGYVQGLNEIVGPMYYVFRHDRGGASARDAADLEADTFFCFMNLVSRLHFYIEDMDAAQGGIVSILDDLYDRLRHLDPRLWHHLTMLGIQPAFYALRWITALFTREFPLPDTCRLWDTMFTITQEDLIPFIQAFSCAMLIAIRTDLLHLQHDAALQLLQDYPRTVRVETLLDLCDAIHAGAYPPTAPLLRPLERFASFLRTKRPESSHGRGRAESAAPQYLVRQFSQ